MYDSLCARTSTTLIGVLMLTASAATAQSVPVEPGMQVRVEMGSFSVFGELVRLDPDSVVILIGRRIEAYPVARVKRLDVSTGKTRSTGRGAVLGAMSGAIIGSLIANMRVAPRTTSFCLFECEEGQPRTRDRDDDVSVEVVLLAALGGAIVAGAFGAAIGSGILSDQWERVSLDLSVSASAAGGRALRPQFTLVIRR